MQVKTNANDKEVLYSILRREINNFAVQFPLIGIFGDVIANYVIGFIDPYVSAFLTPQGKLETDTLKAFAAKEVSDKIEHFKAQFEAERKEYNSNEN